MVKYPHSGKLRSAKDQTSSYQIIRVSVLLYGLSTLTLEDKRLKEIDSWYINFLRRVVGIKASYCSTTPNSTVWAKIDYTALPSQTLLSDGLFSANALGVFQQDVKTQAGYSSQLRVNGFLGLKQFLPKNPSHSARLAAAPTRFACLFSSLAHGGR